MGKRAINDDEGEFTVAGTNATGGPIKQVSRFQLVGATVHFIVTSGSYRLQASNDGSSWLEIDGGAIAATAFVALNANYRFLRVYTTTAGDGEAHLFAHEELY